MPKVTIAGSGIIGLAIASQLPRDFEVTIVASILPGDPENSTWASPYAGGIWMPVHGSDVTEQQLQLTANAYLRSLAYQYPESGIRVREMIEILDYVPEPKPWFHNRLPKFRVLGKADLPGGALYGMSYEALSVNPPILLAFLRKRLESSGVVFKRMTFEALAELKGLGHDILINATGLGSRNLVDVKDTTTNPTSSQTILVKSNFNKIYMRHGKDYAVPFTYVIPRNDGTVVLGGNRAYGHNMAEISTSMREGIIQRLHQSLPNDFSQDLEDYEIVRDIAGVHPMRSAGTLVERVDLDGQNVIHAYGTMSGGYIYSFGVAQEAVRLVNKALFSSQAGKL